MPENITIDHFEGTITYADTEDIPKENAQEIMNLRPHGGRLIKTFAYGRRITTIIPTP